MFCSFTRFFIQFFFLQILYFLFWRTISASHVLLNSCVMGYQRLSLSNTLYVHDILHYPLPCTYTISSTIPALYVHKVLHHYLSRTSVGRPTTLNQYLATTRYLVCARHLHLSAGRTDVRLPCLAALSVSVMGPPTGAHHIISNPATL